MQVFLDRFAATPASGVHVAIPARRFHARCLVLRDQAVPLHAVAGG
jgi:hypothetical protein